jgi:2-polyprenyl-3-methyl-5-hydroxy-6-metoxy-1,4-benzoquinol methylase
MNCRFCNTILHHEFVDLGHSPPSNAYLTAGQLNEPETYFPLKLFVCHQCWLVQVDEYQRADEIFNHQYAYFSSYSRSWLEHSERYTNYMIDRFGFHAASRVVELASNDGYLLQYFHQKGIPVLGIEPTASTAVVARQKGIETLTEFFGVSFARQLVEQRGPADLLLGNNVLAHVPDINDFVKGLKIALKPHGVITLEFPHLLRLVQHNQFDTIYHEHFSYLSFTTVSQIFAAHGLPLFDVQELPTHGGSLRIFAHHDADTNHTLHPAVDHVLEAEASAGLRTLAYYEGFQARVNEVKVQFLDFLIQQKKAGKKVAGYGAAAKGNTLLNYCGVRPDLLAFVADASPHKQGKFLPGSHVPIVTEEELKAERPDFVVVFPWNIRQEIERQLAYIESWGGKLVVAIPQLQIV